MKKIIISLLLVISCTISPVFAAPQESMEEKSLDTHITETISDIINIANAEIGYLEKNSNDSLYDKTTNAGSANYTKYANDLANWGFYQGSMQGQPWCDIFVDWCFCAAFGVADAKTITCQNPYGSAACVSSMGYFQAVGQFYKTPQPGDQIFFTRGEGSNHTGLVYKVDGNTVYTIEGNTNSDNGVVANGGAVKAKSYDINSSRIAGYGRPNYTQIAQKRKTTHDELVKKHNEEVKKHNEEVQKEKIREQMLNKDFGFMQ
jgi:hypothetical protein